MTYHQTTPTTDAPTPNQTADAAMADHPTLDGTTPATRASTTDQSGSAVTTAAVSTDGATAQHTVGPRISPESDPAPEPDTLGETVIEASGLAVHYGENQALRDISMEIPERGVTALIGPSGCGKSTFLRSINRMNDLIDSCRVEGDLVFHGKNVYDDDVDPVALRRKIGMVFQEPNPFPKSIYDNVAYGPRIQGYEGDLDEIVEDALRRAALWDEVKDNLDASGLDLSGGQQQRLCIARAIAPDPEVLLMDEPASALDPIATAKVEELVADLASEYTVVVVTHNMQQAERISDRTAVFLTGGELAEVGPTGRIFENPRDDRVADYIAGKFG